MERLNTPKGFYPPEQLYVLSLRIMDCVEELFVSLDLPRLQRDGKKYTGQCPVHGGRKYNALNIYHQGESCVGNWKCRTKGCHNHFANTIVGFTRGVLSHQRYNWNEDGDKKATLQETVEFLLELLNINLNKLHIDDEAMEKRFFVNAVNNNNLNNPSNIPSIEGVPRQIIRQRLHIPAEYYLKRGYSKAILDKYDIGLCEDVGKAMFNRVVVPVYDNMHTQMIGCSGRSVYDKCPKCKTWHPLNTACPTTPQEKKPFCKWKHSDGFRAECHLYNYWFAKNIIKQTGTCILVESPGNVWRLEEAGVHNSVAIFGTTLNNLQQRILDCSGVLTIIVLMDNDENGAGQKAAAQIKKQCERIYNVKLTTPFPDCSKFVDVGDMTVGEIKQYLVPRLN